MAKSKKIFCSYAHQDTELLQALKAHLEPLKRQGQITLWTDADINAGIEWEQEIKHHLDTADIILLLISPAFMASDYCYGNEMKQALARHERQEARVIPVILRPVSWQDAPLSKLQVLPGRARPVTDSSWHSDDHAWMDVVAGIQRVMRELAENGEERATFGEQERKLLNEEQQVKADVSSTQKLRSFPTSRVSIHQKKLFIRPLFQNVSIGKPLPFVALVFLLVVGSIGLYWWEKTLPDPHALTTTPPPSAISAKDLSCPSRSICLYENKDGTGEMKPCLVSVCRTRLCDSSEPNGCVEEEHRSSWLLTLPSGAAEHRLGRDEHAAFRPK